MANRQPWQVILVPGAVLPAEPAYAGLLAALGADVDARAKDLELYASDVVPPAGYRFEMEVDGILRVADEAGFGRFHLVGYSAGGAASLAFAAGHPDRLHSLALLEPAFAGHQGQTPEEAAVWQRLRRISELPADARMSAFVRIQLAADAEPPPPPPEPPAWMASRVAALGELSGIVDRFQPDLGALRRFDRPVYFALGGRSNPDLYARLAARLAEVFPDFTLDTFEDRHHFDPPHRLEPERLANALRALWSRADGGQAEAAGGGSDAGST